MAEHSTREQRLKAAMMLAHDPAVSSGVIGLECGVSQGIGSYWKRLWHAEGTTALVDGYHGRNKEAPNNPGKGLPRLPPEARSINRMPYGTSPRAFARAEVEARTAGLAPLHNYLEPGPQPTAADIVRGTLANLEAKLEAQRTQYLALQEEIRTTKRAIAAIRVIAEEHGAAGADAGTTSDPDPSVELTTAPHTD